VTKLKSIAINSVVFQWGQADSNVNSPLRYLMDDPFIVEEIKGLGPTDWVNNLSKPVQGTSTLMSRSFENIHLAIVLRINTSKRWTTKAPALWKNAREIVYELIQASMNPSGLTSEALEVNVLDVLGNTYTLTGILEGVETDHFVKDPRITIRLVGTTHYWKGLLLGGLTIVVRDPGPATNGQFFYDMPGHFNVGADMSFIVNTTGTTNIYVTPQAASSSRWWLLYGVPCVAGDVITINSANFKGVKLNRGATVIDLAPYLTLSDSGGEWPVFPPGVNCEGRIVVTTAAWTPSIVTTTSRTIQLISAIPRYAGF
jgi:hypothetical protein